MSNNFLTFLNLVFSKEEEEDNAEYNLERIDIPRSLLDTEKYCATLGHKGKSQEINCLVYTFSSFQNMT